MNAKDWHMRQYNNFVTLVAHKKSEIDYQKNIGFMDSAWVKDKEEGIKFF